MLKFSKNKIKMQLILLIAISLFMTIVVSAYYFLNFNHLSRKRASTYFTNITKQLENQITSLNKVIEGSSDTVSYSKIAQSFLLEYDLSIRLEATLPYMQDILNKIVYTNSSIQNIKIIDKYGTELRSDTDDKFVIYNAIINDYNILSDNFKTDFYTNAYLDDTTNNYFYAYVRPVFATENFRKDKIGLNVIMCKSDNLQQIINNASILTGAQILLSDSSGRLFASNDQSLIGKDTDMLFSSEQIKNNNEIVEYNNSECLVQVTEIKSTGWKIYFLVYLSDITSDLNPIKKFGIILACFNIIIILVLGIILIISITLPISRIVSQMENIGTNGMKYKLKYSGENEISTISKNINDMLDRIEDTTRRIFLTQDKLYCTEILKKKAELIALQSQINPHFLYNTLECIRSIGVYHNINDISQISTSMSKIFRYAIKKQDIVSIRDELECISEYNKIMSIRHMGRFEIHMDVQKEIYDSEVIKMILQPIVENAFYHGLEGKLGPGNLYIKGFSDGTTITMEITDDGKGITKEDLLSLRDYLNEDYSIENEMNSHMDKRSIGLANINSRLKFTYGDNCSMDIESAIDNGTTVRIKIPYKAYSDYQIQN